MSSSEVTKEASVHGNKTFERALERGVKQLVAVKLPVWVWHAICSCHEAVGVTAQLQMSHAGH